jgi:catechol 2,3-dioxygenase-like lactoylglutathione lyase family enzyme
VIPQPLIAVADVAASSRWYQSVLGARSGHGGAEYERLFDADGRMILQLHHMGTDHHHGPIADPAQPRGNGALIWFETEAFDAAMERVAASGAEVVIPRHRNPNALHWECWLRDPDGYVVVLASPDGTAP